MNAELDLPSRKLVGVYGDPVLTVRKSFKQEALLFDQIVIPELDEHLSSRAAHPELGPLIPNFYDLFFLRDAGILRSAHIRGIESLKRVRSLAVHEDGTIGSAMEAVENERYTDVAALFNVCDGDLRDTGKVRRLIYAAAAKGWRAGVIEPVLSRVLSLQLLDEEINAVPLFQSRMEASRAFAKGNSGVLQLILTRMPAPSEETPWEDIIEFRTDPAARKRLNALRAWARKFDIEARSKSAAEIREEIEALLEEYEQHMRLHRLKVNFVALATMLVAGVEAIDDLIKGKLASFMKPALELSLVLRYRKWDLLNAELSAPNRELAFLSSARRRFADGR